VVELVSSSERRILSSPKKRETVKGPGLFCQAKNFNYSGEVLLVQNEVNPSSIFVMLIQWKNSLDLPAEDL